MEPGPAAPAGAPAVTTRAPAALRWLSPVLVLGTAVSTANTKLAGAAWFTLCVLGLWLGLSRSCARASELTRAAGSWFAACIACLGLWTLLAWLWREPCCGLSADLNSGLRLLLAAAASWVIARHAIASERWQRGLRVALVLACLVALGLAVTHERTDLPTHPIPWAVAVSLLVCLLLPHALQPQEPALARWTWGLGCAGGIGAVLASQSRGAFAILPWAMLLAGWSLARRRGITVRSRHVVAALMLLVALAGVAVSLPSDPLRIRKAANEVVHAIDTADYNSSLGARVYLFRLGWHGFLESPWIGIGAEERLRRIRHAGENLPPTEYAKLEQVRQLGHVHNQYLHNAMDGGVIGLAGLLALIVGMVVAAMRLARVSPLASQQMTGVTLMHALAGLSNVNFAHNYYAVMLALSIGLIFLDAGWTTPAATGPAGHGDSARS